MVAIEDFQGSENFKLLLARASKTQAANVWGTFAVFALVIFMAFSSWHFSSLLTLSSLCSMFSFLMVAMTIDTTKSVEGVSLKMMECYMLVFFFRMFAIIPFEGYLPFDHTGEWLYRICEVAGLCLSGSIVYCIRVQHSRTYDESVDAFNHWWIIVPCVGFALVFHAHLARFAPADVCWAFSLYLESVCVLPQFMMFMKQGRAQSHISHFLAAQALSRLLSFVFWVSSYSELSNPRHSVKQFTGHWVVGIQLLQLIVMGDFVYHYIRALRKGSPISDLMQHCSNV